MVDKDIKTGDQIVREFLDSLKFTPAKRQELVDSIYQLNEEGKLTKTNLLQALSEIRKVEISVSKEEIQ